MKIYEIREMPICVDEIPAGAKGVHESTLMAYQILQKVKSYLRRGVPADVVMELIEEMEG